MHKKLNLNQESEPHEAANNRDRNRETNRHRNGGFSIRSLLDGKPNAQLLFVGSLNCTRHRGFQMGDLMREGRMAILCPTASDFATGRYLHQIVAAIVELSEERNSKEFVLMYGCQCALLSTDFELISQELKDEYDIYLSIHEHCHLCQKDDERSHYDEIRKDVM